MAKSRKVYYDSKTKPSVQLDPSDDLIAVRTRSRRSLTRSSMPVPDPAAAELRDAVLVADYPEAGVEVYRIPPAGKQRSMSERKTALAQAPDVQFAGSVLVDRVSREPVLYTENLFVKFEDDTDPDHCQDVLREAGLTVKHEVSYATNAFFVGAPEGSGQTVFDIAEKLLKRRDVEYAHPELIRPRARKGIFPEQWHLKKTAIGGAVIDAHANVEAAHAVTTGAGVTIAVIDDGFDVDHVEFAGSGKVVAPRDATQMSSDPRPKADDEDHGTACAGVACGNGADGASGVAPAAKLMPIRLVSGLGSQREADAFAWATSKGADVISCSWGPPDGVWFRPDDPRHNQNFPLPASTRLAIDFAATQGRGGKGCVILFAAGNGRESVDNDGYASHSSVIAVAACNDRGKQSVYSDFGAALWCAFPSNDRGHAPFNHPQPLTTGIWTTDRSGPGGYNPGSLGEGDAAGHYTNSFGGTSSACPGAAGVAALVLSVNPALRAVDVRDILKRSCDRIDPQGGAYDANGHSAKYGFGRLNARTAVELARPQPQSAVVVKRIFDAPILDLQTVTFDLTVSESESVTALAAEIELAHTYIGDLVITLHPPDNGAAITLHRRAGGSAGELKKRYDAANAPALSRFQGKSCKGTWTLKIRDAAAEDSGTLGSFALVLSFAHPRSAVAPERGLARRRKAKAARATPAVNSPTRDRAAAPAAGRAKRKNRE